MLVDPVINVYKIPFYDTKTPRQEGKGVYQSRPTISESVSSDVVLENDVVA